MMGDKLAARQVARDAGVAPVPGAMFAVDEPDAVRQFGDELGWPLAVKAVHGGGGRGMRVVAGPDEVAEVAGRGADAKRSRRSGGPSCTSSGSSPVRATSRCRLVADHHGGLVVVGDRDCSIQRRYQKLIEEAPAPHASRTPSAPGSPRQRHGWPEPSATPTPEPIEFLVEERRAVLPRDEHPHPGRAPGHRARQRCRSRRRADPRRRRRSRSRSGRRTSSRAAPRSRCGSTPRTPPTGASCPRPGRLHRFELPAGDHVRVDTGYRAGDEIPAGVRQPHRQDRGVGCRPRGGPTTGTRRAWAGSSSTECRRLLRSPPPCWPTTTSAPSAIRRAGWPTTLDSAVGARTTCRCSAAGTASRVSTTRLVARGPTAERTTRIRPASWSATDAIGVDQQPAVPATAG